MSFEYFCHKNTISPPEAGLYLLNGTVWGPGPLPAFGSAEANDRGWGRGIQLGSPAVAAGGKSIYISNDDDIYSLAGPLSPVLSGLGVNTERSAFCHVWGRDNRPYVVSLILGIGPANVSIAEYDVLLGTWSLVQPSVIQGGSAGSSLSTAVGFKNKCYAGSNSGIFVYDPVQKSISGIQKSGGSGVRGKIFTTPGRLWYVGEGSSNDLFLWEIIGPITVPVATLGGHGVGTNGDFTVIPSLVDTAVVFNADDGVNAGDRVMAIDHGTGGPGSGATITDITSTVFGGITSPGAGLPPEEYPSLASPGNQSRFYSCAIDMNLLDNSTGPGTTGNGSATFWESTVVAPGVGSAYGYNGKAPATKLSTGAAIPGITRVSEFVGGHLTKFNGVIPEDWLQIEDVQSYSDDTITNGLQIFYRIYHNAGLSGVGTVQMFYMPEVPGSQIGPQPRIETVISEPVIGGTLDVPNNKIVNAPSGDVGGGVNPVAPLNSFVWDYGALGVPAFTHPRICIALVP